LLRLRDTAIEAACLARDGRLGVGGSCDCAQDDSRLVAEVSGTANRAMPLPQVMAPIAIRGA